MTEGEAWRQLLAPTQGKPRRCPLRREVLLEPANPTHEVLPQLLSRCLQRGAAATGLWPAKTGLLIQLRLHGKLRQPLAHGKDATVG